MLNKNTFFLAILLESNCLNLASSETSGIKECNFKAYRGLSFVGGSQNHAPAKSKFKCILGCASNVSCQGFAYDGGECLQADRSGSRTLAFTADLENIRIRRNVLLQNLKFDPASLVSESIVTLMNKLNIGDLLYLKAKLLKHKNVQIEIYDKPDKVNITYQMRARCDETCDLRYVTIDFKLNNVWDTTGYAQSTSYTLQVNKIFEVHVLITANGIMTYLNGVFLYNLTSIFTALTANFGCIKGTMEILEFSL